MNADSRDEVIRRPELVDINKSRSWRVVHVLSTADNLLLLLNSGSLSTCICFPPLSGPRNSLSIGLRSQQTAFFTDVRFCVGLIFSRRPVGGMDGSVCIPAQLPFAFPLLFSLRVGGLISSDQDIPSSDPEGAIIKVKMAIGFDVGSVAVVLLLVLVFVPRTEVTGLMTIR